MASHGKVTSSEQATGSCQGSSLDGRTSQEGPVKIDVVEEPEASPSEHRANETQKIEGQLSPSVTNGHAAN
jgi:hypothetical protein